MESFISMFEIPASEFTRAVSFYKAVLNIDIEEVDMGGIRMGLFPNDGTNISVSVIAGEGYNPSPDGAVIYLNGGSDLQVILDRVAASSGTIIVPKTEISPEMGFYALFTDTEGNRLGVYSQS
ncbi:VOC family protein [Dyadobacter aurulentus]|uniref:VOC family protein n=1 Tax=Dyadobacter sp. UC 10 TaxID=2605428 RepID=UPI0011F09F91|nr:VOC family protein [Dyadobacter sp. UC 10]KAA0992606.1 VOC family protein [Dyadobacter sp. UC 10]